MSKKTGTNRGLPGLELALLASVVILLFQLLPLLASEWGRLADVRNWTRAGWMVVSVVILVVLIGIRFGPELYDEWRKRLGRRSPKREMDRKQLSLKDERALYERMAEARKRQVM